MGLGFGLAGAAGGAAESLKDLLARKYREQLDVQAAEERQRAFDRQLAQDAEQTRRWDLTNERQVAADKALADMRAAEAERDRAEAARRGGQQGVLTGILADPAKISALSPLQRLVTLNQAGMANVGLHDQSPT